MYDSVADTDMRLGGSIVTVDGKPVLIESVGEGPNNTFILYGKALYGDYKTLVIRLDSPHLCVSSAPLGYIQYGMNSYYVCRSPNRRQKQGIDANQVIYYTNGKREPRRGLPYEEVAKAIVGTSKDNLKKAKDYIISGDNCGSSFALTSDVAISFDKLYFHAHEIGTVALKGGVFVCTITKPAFHTYDFTEVFDEDFRVIAE